MRLSRGATADTADISRGRESTMRLRPFHNIFSIGRVLRYMCASDQPHSRHSRHLQGQGIHYAPADTPQHQHQDHPQHQPSILLRMHDAAGISKGRGSTVRQHQSSKLLRVVSPTAIAADVSSGASAQHRRLGCHCASTLGLPLWALQWGPLKFPAPWD